MHDQRFRKYGSYELPSIEDKFWARVNKNGPLPPKHPELGPCWLWTGSTTGPYGQYRVRSVPCSGLAHRAAWWFVHGSLTPDWHVDHLCEVKLCVRTLLDPTCPSHIEEKSRRDNILRSDSFSGINSRKEQCDERHEYTPENTIWENGWRRCRTCRNTNARRRGRQRRLIAQGMG